MCTFAILLYLHKYQYTFIMRDIKTYCFQYNSLPSELLGVVYYWVNTVTPSDLSYSVSQCG